MSITVISDGELAARREITALAGAICDQAATIERLRGEATVLRELLEQCLEPLGTLAEGECDNEDWEMLAQLQGDIRRALVPAGALPAADEGQRELLG